MHRANRRETLQFLSRDQTLLKGWVVANKAALDEFIKEFWFNVQKVTALLCVV